MYNHATMPHQVPTRSGRMRYLLAEYLAPLLAALAVTLVLMWPLPLYFSAR